MHEPVGQVHFVVFENLQVLIYSKKHEKNRNINEKQILTARAFLVHSTDWLKQTTTFVKFKLFQDPRFKNHAAKNMEMCKDRFYTILLKITSFTIISKSYCF